MLNKTRTLSEFSLTSVLEKFLSTCTILSLNYKLLKRRTHCFNPSRCLVIKISEKKDENSIYLLPLSLHLSHSNSFFFLPPSSITSPVVSQSIWCCNTVGLLWPHFPRCICGSGLSWELIGWEDRGIDQLLPGVRSAWCSTGVCPTSTHHWLPVFHPSCQSVLHFLSLPLSPYYKVCSSDVFFLKCFFLVPLHIFFFKLLPDWSISLIFWNHPQSDMKLES